MNFNDEEHLKNFNNLIKTINLNINNQHYNKVNNDYVFYFEDFILEIPINYLKNEDLILEKDILKEIYSDKKIYGYEILFFKHEMDKKIKLFNEEKTNKKISNLNNEIRKELSHE